MFRLILMICCLLLMLGSLFCLCWWGQLGVQARRFHTNRLLWSLRFALVCCILLAFLSLV